LLDTSLRSLIIRAYEVFQDVEIIGGADWQRSRRFDIQGKAEDPTAGLNALNAMLRTLLEDRFQLRVHTETREMPIYALVLARDDGRPGAGIKPSTTDCSNPEQVAKMRASAVAGQGMPCAIWPVASRVPGSMTQRAIGVSMAELASSLTAQTRRRVRDQTKLGGRDDGELTYDRRATLSPAQADTTSDSPVLTTALQEQLGLKLESSRGPVEVLVIDSAALPEPD
jgi:uncharacterized protein (TIGR03435 family)